MTSQDLHQTDRGGLTAGDLMTVRRELFRDALAVAQHDHDPSIEWDAFCETAWREAGLAFGFLDREAWPDELPRPNLGPASDDGSHSDRDAIT